MVDGVEGLVIVVQVLVVQVVDAVVIPRTLLLPFSN
jgi:hypothetical protein